MLCGYCAYVWIMNMPIEDVSSNITSSINIALHSYFSINIIIWSAKISIVGILRVIFSLFYYSSIDAH